MTDHFEHLHAMYSRAVDLVHISLMSNIEHKNSVSIFLSSVFSELPIIRN